MSKSLLTRLAAAIALTALLSLAPLARPAVADDRVGELIQQAGNADDDTARLDILKELQQVPDLDGQVRTDVDRMVKEVERYISDAHLTYFGRQVLDKGNYEFGIAEDSPLYPLALLYQARMQTWVTVEYGGYWSDPEARRKQFNKIRPMFEEVRRHFPENRLVRMYLGEPLEPDKEFPAVPDAPEWAVHQREALERLADIITWWIDNRMQANGEYGGGWGDDCEMWRWWAPVLIAFDDPKITAAQARFSKALFNQEHLAGGYTTHVYDVQHTSEDSSDALTPMMHLEPDNDEWSARALRLAELMRTLWTGVNERGFLQFKSTYFSVDKVDPDPRKACDTVYHPRAVQPALLYWQRTGDEALTKLFTAWMDAWVDATVRAERGKPAGIIPSAIHWPDGGIGGLGENWWDPENHTRDPLYVWPSAMSMMTNTLLLAHQMSKDPKYLEPIRSMVRARLDFLENPSAEQPEKGTQAWCASKMRGLSDVAAKHKFLTGSAEFDELLAKDRSPYMALRLDGDRAALTSALRDTAEALRVNFPGYTSEVRYTDRVLRFPRLFGENAMYPDARSDIKAPDTGLLYVTATGDPGSGQYFPTNAVRWLTPPRDIAALVTDAGEDRFVAELFHFGDEPRSMAAELYLLSPGDYTLSVSPGQENQFRVTGKRTRIAFEVPAKELCVLRVTRRLTPRESLGKTDKYRVLVDKVLMQSTDWFMTEDQVREISAAGFNVVCPRIGGTDMKRVRRVAELAQKHGIYYMAWMRGTLTATEGTKLVWASGTIQDLYSPNADGLWDWKAGNILDLAKLSAEIPSIIGVFLDYENYAKNKQGNCYALSYDEKILEEFAQAKGVELPELAAAERFPWLKDKGLHDAFAAFQIGAWRARCRKLREQVDQINPRFQFIVYPAPGTLFMREAIYPEWATEQTPLILADAVTYGRGSGLESHPEALEGNRRKLLDNIEYARSRNIPFLYMGGIDPVCEGADPEFNGKNAVMISDVSDGYWIFYEGPTYGKPDHAAHWRWFTRANREIAANRFELQREPRETPDTLGLTKLERKTDKLQISLYGMKPRMHDLIEQTGKFEVHELQGKTLEYLSGLDVVVLQNFNAALRADSPLVQALRAYVEQGGGVLLAHDTIWYMATPFPEIATRAVPTHEQNVEAGRHVAEVDLAVVEAHEAIGGQQPGVKFTPEFRDHMIFKPGEKGAVVIRNTLDDPVYVAGEFGKGRVVFAGSYYGYNRDLEGTEREVFLAMLDWLAQK